LSLAARQVLGQICLIGAQIFRDQRAIRLMAPQKIDRQSRDDQSHPACPAAAALAAKLPQLFDNRRARSLGKIPETDRRRAQPLSLDDSESFFDGVVDKIGILSDEDIPRAFVALNHSRRSASFPARSSTRCLRNYVFPSCASITRNFWWQASSLAARAPSRNSFLLTESEFDGHKFVSIDEHAQVIKRQIGVTLPVYFLTKQKAPTSFEVGAF